MKTYDDLTNTQLLELAALAHDQPATAMICVRRQAYHCSVEGQNYVRIHFNIVDGTINRTRHEMTHPVYNMFRIVDKCREWGINYV